MDPHSVAEGIKAVLSIPITQLVGVVLVISLAEHNGIPVIDMLKVLLRLKPAAESSGKGGDGMDASVLQDIKNSFAQQTRGYKEDTTAVLTQIQVELGKVASAVSQSSESRKESEERLERILDDIRNNGVRIRKN